MKIVLINPPILGDRVMRDFKKFESMRGIYPPLGLLYIAAVLLDEGHEVRVIDCDAEDDHEAAVRGACTSPSPDAVGFYAFTWNYRQAVRLADLVKELAPAGTEEDLVSGMRRIGARYLLLLRVTDGLNREEWADYRGGLPAEEWGVCVAALSRGAASELGGVFARVFQCPFGVVYELRDGPGAERGPGT